MKRKIYINAAKQISIQQPLSEEWMVSPLTYNGGLAHVVEANYRDFLSPMEARRMAPIMKRALATALEAIKQSGIDHPEAIITGTSIGSLEYTERFLEAMVENNEQLLKPTYFMQSTHNTVGSMLGIYTKTHGYNTTYSHGSISFELALQDAWTQMQLGKLNNALVCGNEEMVDSYYELLAKTGYVGFEGMYPCGELSVSMVLSTEANDHSLCEVTGISVFRSTSSEGVEQQVKRFIESVGLTVGNIDVVFTGMNGNPENDACYGNITNRLFNSLPTAAYKKTFGENFTSAALGVYAAAHCLNKTHVPTFMYYKNVPNEDFMPQNILFVNHQKGKDFSVILLKKL